MIPDYEIWVCGMEPAVREACVVPLACMCSAPCLYVWYPLLACVVGAPCLHVRYPLLACVGAYLDVHELSAAAAIQDPANPETPTQTFPILQSYLDAVNGPDIAANYYPFNFVLPTGDLFNW